MIRYLVPAGIGALVAIAGCAIAEQKAEEEAYRAPVYRTGSHLPAGREAGDSSQRELSAAERRTVEDLQNRPRAPAGPVTK